MSKSLKTLLGRALILSAGFIISLCYFVNSFAQQAPVFQLNKTNGLPSNHVYCAIVDHNGYLWLGTDNGVIKYNGYEIKEFNYNNGLPNIDVWDLYEDAKGRLILMSIARGMGYIKNNRYIPFHVDKGKDDLIHPNLLREHDDTIKFYDLISNGIWRGAEANIIGDTIYMHELSEVDVNVVENYSFIPGLGIVLLQNDTTFAIDIYTNKKQYLCANIPELAYYYNTPFNDIFFKDSVLIKYAFGHTDIEFVDYNQCTIDTVHLNKYSNGTNQLLEYIYVAKDNLYVITRDSIFVYNKQARLLNRYAVSNVAGSKNIKGVRGSYFQDDPLWGKFITTPNEGLYLNFFDKESPFTNSYTNYGSNKYLGCKGRDTSYWWSPETSSILLVKGTKLIQSIYYHRSPPWKLIPYDNEYGIILSHYNNDNYFFSYKTHSVKLIGEDYKHVEVNGYGVLAPKHTLKFNKYNVVRDIRDAVVIDTNTIYKIGTQYQGLQHYDLTDKDTIKCSVIDSVKYNGIHYVKGLNTIICNSNDVIYFYNIKKKQYHHVSYQDLTSNGINRVEHIHIDKHENIFIQDYNNLFSINAENYSINRVFEGLELKGAYINIYDDIITIGGSFGVMQYKTYSNDSFSLLKYFPNAKGLFYNDIRNMFVSDSSILLGTDKGSYTVDINKGFDRDDQNVKFLVTYNERTFDLSDKDTVILTQKNQTIYFDVVNPTGFGALHFQYKLPDSLDWTMISEKSIRLQQLNAGKYHTILLQAKDDAWRSKIYAATIYIQPYWWQTIYGKLAIFLAILLILVVIILLVIYFTRKIISRNNEKKNQQRDLELKSIYSQINPHFIFNTLGTAQYFIRKNQTKEAYAHISQFSDLLRAYLRSSRNKYIFISEEVENLQNYLQLQLSRFEHKFNYHITVDDKLDPLTTTIPSLLLQPIVENALNHGIFHMEGTGELNIKFLKGNAQEQLICIVEDNGIGRARSKQLRGKIIRKADSYGTILIKELIDIFNKYEPVSINLEYIDKQEPETGTMVKITIDNTRSNPSNDQSNNS